MRADLARSTIVWLLLVGVTLLAWWLVHRQPAPDHGLSRPIVAAMLVMAFVKAGLVVAYFMEVRVAPRLFQILLGLFGALLCGALILLIA